MKWDGKLPSGFQLLLFSLSSTCSQLGPAHTHACMGVGSNTLYFLFLVLQTLLFLHCMHHLSVGTENSIYKYSSVCWGQDQCEQTVSSLSTTVEWKTWKERLAPSQKKDVGVMRAYCSSAGVSATFCPSFICEYFDWTHTSCVIVQSFMWLLMKKLQLQKWTRSNTPQRPPTWCASLPEGHLMYNVEYSHSEMVPSKVLSFS